MNLEQILTELKAIKKDLNSIFAEREAVIDGLMLGLISGQHVLMLGPPGTGKSMLARELCRRINGSYFQVLLTKTTAPEELFGPYSIAALKEGKYVRLTEGYLPQADVAFVDEVFKASSAILNTLLWILNEGVFRNGTGVAAVPLKLCVAASNELPQEREELAALWDRFALRYVLNPVASRSARMQMLASAEDTVPQATLTLEELEAARRASAQVAVPPAVAEAVVDIADRLRERGMYISDRRLKRSLTVIRASAFLRGCAEAGIEDTLPLADMLWDTPDRLPDAAEAVYAVAAPAVQESAKIVDAALQSAGRFATAVRQGDLSGEAQAGQMAEVVFKLKEAARQIGEALMHVPETLFTRIKEQQQRIIEGVVALASVVVKDAKAHPEDQMAVPRAVGNIKSLADVLAQLDPDGPEIQSLRRVQAELLSKLGV